MHATGPDATDWSIDEAGHALAQRRISARELAEAHLARIAKFNPAYNAIITPNPRVLEEADSIDRALRAGARCGPLAGIPIVVKDTVDMQGLPSTAGWAPLSARAGGIDLLPAADAAVIARLRAAGAVILGKTNVPVLCLSSQHANDSWAGPTYNAAAPTRMPGGSSAGTATAVAARFAVWGVAEETGGSIQFPAAYQGLVGVKPTFGLVPTTGVVPLAGSTRDVLGPIARSVRDASIALDAMAGETFEDSRTAAARGRVPAQGYAASLAGASLAGKRIGLLGPGWLELPVAREAHELYERAIEVVRRAGATVVDDPFAGTGFASLAKPTGGWKYDLRGEESVAWDLEQYLARLGPGAAARSVAELARVIGFDPFAEDGPLGYEREQPVFVQSLADLSRPPDLSAFHAARVGYVRLFDEVMSRHGLDAMLFPQALDEPPLIAGKGRVDAATVSQINIGGFPGVAVPAGEYASGTPFSVIWVGRCWSEATLLQLAHAFEQLWPARRMRGMITDAGELKRIAGR